VVAQGLFGTSNEPAKKAEYELFANTRLKPLALKAFCYFRRNSPAKASHSISKSSVAWWPAAKSHHNDVPSRPKGEILWRSLCSSKWG